MAIAKIGLYDLVRLNSTPFNFTQQCSWNHSNLASLFLHVIILFQAG